MRLWVLASGRVSALAREMAAILAEPVRFDLGEPDDGFELPGRGTASAFAEVLGEPARTHCSRASVTVESEGRTSLPGPRGLG